MAISRGDPDWDLYLSKPNRNASKHDPWTPDQELAWRQWVQLLVQQYHCEYMGWCIDHHMRPDWDNGYYQFLCMLSGVEDEDAT